MPKHSGEAYRNIRLCVDCYERGEMSGQFYFPALDVQSRPFQSLIEFLTVAERTLDEAGFPQSYTAKRTFGVKPDALVLDSGVNRLETGRLATFDLRLLFRQHASWQGTVTWVEGGADLSFRSVLELILLLVSALEGESD